MNDEVTTIDKFDELKKQLENTNSKRDILINTLMSSFEQLGNINLKEWDSDNKEATMAVVNSVNNLLNSKDSANINLVKLNIQAKKNDNDENAASVVSEFLKTIGTDFIKNGFINTNPKEDDRLVNESFNKSDEEITDGELETND